MLYELFLVKVIVWRSFTKKTWKESFLNSPIFFSREIFFLKAHKVPEKKKKKDVETYLEPSRTLKMELCAEIGHDF